MTLSYNMYMFTLLDFFLFCRKKNNAVLEFNRASAVSKEEILIVHYICQNFPIIQIFLNLNMLFCRMNSLQLINLKEIDRNVFRPTLNIPFQIIVR